MVGVVGVYALKGGVGKTSAAVNLAWLSAQSGRRTLLWDLDPQAAATFLMRAKAKVKGGTRGLLQGETDAHAAIRETGYECLDLLPAEALYQSADLDLDEVKKSERRVQRVVRELSDSYDVIILDCPPGLSLLSANIVHAADLLLVPIVPSPLSLRTLDQVVDFAGGVENHSPHVLAFLSMVDQRRALHREVVELVGGRYGDVAKAVIPASATIERMGQRRAPVVAWAAHTRAAEAYVQLWNEVVTRLPASAGTPVS